MSIIAGLLFKRDKENIAEVLDLLYRGIRRYPADRTGYWRDASAALACGLQWITPESCKEESPCVDQERGLAIAADAIVDNREELFGRLGLSSVQGGALTDSELILLAYDRWGEDTPAYLVGDYAFVIWDSRSSCLFGARDPLGSRTLYYTDDGGRFAFCTAIRPLLGLPGVPVQINENWLSEYLAIPTMLDAADPFSTVHTAIRQLPPSHSFKIPVSGRMTIRRHETLIPSGQLRYRSDQEYVEAFRDVFGQAVRSKLRTYRGVGASLSGGLDSGAVVSYAARALQAEGKTLHTYSYVPPADFDDWTPPPFIANERPFIETTVNHIGGNVSESYLDLADRDPYADLDELLDIREMPYKAFENSFWVRALYEYAGKQGAGVLLTGAQGNHTISWGPALDYYARLLRRLRWIKLYGELRHYSRRMRVGRSRLIPFLLKEAMQSVLPGGPGDADDEGPAMIHPAFAQRTRVRERLNNGDAGLSLRDPDVWIQREAHFGSPAIISMIGTGAAKLSLRYGLWERDPTADPRVVRFCLSLPPDQFVLNGMDRALVRRATQGELPDEVRLNQRVRGMQGVDWVHRMRSAWPRFIDEIRALSRDSLAAGILNTPRIAACMERVKHGAGSELAMDEDVRFLMRCLIVYRFLQRSAKRPSG